MQEEKKTIRIRPRSSESAIEVDLDAVSNATACEASPTSIVSKSE